MQWGAGAAVGSTLAGMAVDTWGFVPMFRSAGGLAIIGAACVVLQVRFAAGDCIPGPHAHLHNARAQTQFLARRYGDARAGVAVLKAASTTRRASATVTGSDGGEFAAASAEDNAEGETDTTRLVAE